MKNITGYINKKTSHDVINNANKHTRQIIDVNVRQEVFYTIRLLVSSSLELAVYENVINGIEHTHKIRLI